LFELSNGQILDMFSKQRRTNRTFNAISDRLLHDNAKDAPGFEKRRATVCSYKPKEARQDAIQG
jgi:hypothetical protein